MRLAARVGQKQDYNALFMTLWWSRAAAHAPRRVGPQHAPPHLPQHARRPAEVVVREELGRQRPGATEAAGRAEDEALHLPGEARAERRRRGARQARR